MEKWLIKNGGENLRNLLPSWGKHPGTKDLQTLYDEADGKEIDFQNKQREIQEKFEESYNRANQKTINTPQ